MLYIFFLFLTKWSIFGQSYVEMDGMLVIFSNIIKYEGTYLKTFFSIAFYEIIQFKYFKITSKSYVLIPAHQNTYHVMVWKICIVVCGRIGFQTQPVFLMLVLMVAFFSVCVTMMNW